MATSQNTCKKTTLYMSIATSVLIGFVAGVLYSAFQSPATVASDDGHNHETTALVESLLDQTKTNPNDVEAWVKLGHAYFDSDNPVEAIGAYTKALAINPGNTSVMTDMGVMYRRSGQSKKAVEIFDNVLKFDPNHEQARFNKGVVLLNDFNDKEGAIKQWKILLMNNPDATVPSGEPLKSIIDQIQNGLPSK